MVTDVDGICEGTVTAAGTANATDWPPTVGNTWRADEQVDGAVEAKAAARILMMLFTNC